MPALFAPALIVAALLCAGPGQAQQDAFTVSGVPIDATAANATLAREQAIAAGTPRALRRLLQSLVPAEDRGNIPDVSVTQATGLAVGFSVDNELRSATRYRGDLTVSFDPAGVRRLLGNYSVPFVESAAPPTLVAPVYVVGGQPTLFNANPWADAWDISRYINGFAPVVLPESFGGALISPQAIAAVDLNAVSALASSYGVDRVLVAVAEPAGGALNVRLTLVRLGAEPNYNSAGGGNSGAVAESLGAFTVAANEPQPFVAAADRAQDALENDWKERTVIRSQARTEMRLTVLYDGLGDWHRLRDAIGGSAFVTDVRLDAMSRGGAYMTVTYRGLREQLSADLLRRGVSLRSDTQLGDVAQDSRRAGAAGLTSVSGPGDGGLRAGAPADTVLRAGPQGGL